MWIYGNPAGDPGDPHISSINEGGNEDLPSSISAPHVDDAPIALTDCDLESLPVPRGAIDEVPAAAIVPMNIPKAAIAKQTFTLRAGYRSSAVQAATNTDVDTNLSACFPGHRKRRGHYRQREHK